MLIFPMFRDIRRALDNERNVAFFLIYIATLDTIVVFQSSLDFNYLISFRPSVMKVDHRVAIATPFFCCAHKFISALA
jgi:hypothetical protein